MVEGWAERTPDGFTMHIKAFGLMTRHPVRRSRCRPTPDGMPVDARGRVDRPPRELRGEIFREFLEALEPLRAAGKLGGILFQMPPYVIFEAASLDYLEWARDQLAGDEMLVEFRHRVWLDARTGGEMPRAASRIGARTSTSTRRSSDAAKNLVPTSSRRPRRRHTCASTAATSDVEQARRLAAERFDYLYSARAQ